MKPHRRRNFATCPVETSLACIGGKWKCLIILRLLQRTWRFNELLRSLPGCSQRMLTNQLRELELDEIVHRKIYPQVPPKVEYSLTDIGKKLEPTIKAMCEWGQINIQKVKPDYEGAMGFRSS